MDAPDFCAREQPVGPHATSIAEVLQRAMKLRKRIGHNDRNARGFGKQDAETEGINSLG